MSTTHCTNFVQPTATSQEIRDRGSIFVANIYPATLPALARKQVNHLKHAVHGNKPASHEIAAWRCMVLKHGRTGLEGPDDFELISRSDDDGEQWAGARVLKVMQAHAVIDAVVVVSRWFGDTLIGPSRFTHIEKCASEVCQEFKRLEELKECLVTLGRLDTLLAGLRDEYDGGVGQATLPKAVPRDYTKLDLVKAKRLVKARENAIKSVQSLLAKRPEL